MQRNKGLFGYIGCKALIVATLITLTMVTFGGQAAATQNQQGLPIELYIHEEPQLHEQIVQMRELHRAGLEYLPTGGFFSGLRDMFAGSPEERPSYAPVANLVQDASVIRGHLVETDGIYFPFEDGEGGIVHSMGSTITIELMHGVTPVGFEAVGGEVEGMPVSVVGRVETAVDEVVLRASQIRPSALIAGTRIGRIHEMQADWESAVEAYLAVANHGAFRPRPLAAYARTRVGTIALERLDDTRTARAAYAAGYDAYGKHRNGTPRYYTWVQVEGERWETRGVGQAIGPRLDRINSDRLAYRIVDMFARFAGGNPAIGVILMAFVVRICIYPLTKKQIQSQRRLQKIQPEIKQLQKEHATDKQKFQEEFWALCKRNECNPLGGCLPMLVQMPILIFLYRGISDYIVRFDGVSFLWVPNLADPNMLLLILYTLSMVAFQKLMTKSQPAMDPQQAQQQKMMIYLMPLMFFFFFQGFPAAFLLYWLGSNVIYFGEQAFFMRAHADAPADNQDAAAADKQGAPEDAAPKKSSGFVGKMLDAAKRPQGAQEQQEAPPLSYEEKKKKQEKGGKRGRSGKRR